MADGELVEFLSAEEKRLFVEKNYSTGNAAQSLADVLGEPLNAGHAARAQKLLATDEFIRSLVAQVTNIVANDLSAMKAESATILADIRERSMDQEKPNAAVMAEVARGKLLGLYTDPKERSAEVLKLLSVDSMSDDQLGSVVESMRKLPKETRRSLALMIYDPDEEDESDMRRVNDL